ncbi:MAG: hypothetical protein QHH01_03150 [Spirochaetales bacterium]|nr:hypothetical protein [Spirochaetales bacterium]
MTDQAHQWTFRRLGGTDQAMVKDVQDLMALRGLDPKLWTALSLPVTQPVCGDALTALDQDGDGKVHLHDIIQAVAWFEQSLADPGLIFQETATLDEGSIKDPALIDAFRLAQKLAGGAQQLNPETIDAAIKAFNNHPFNGDGVVVPESAEDSEVASCISSLVDAGYGVPDRSGKLGVNLDSLNSFKNECAAWFTWLEAGRNLALKAPLATVAAAHGLFSELRPIIEDYFSRCAILSLSGSSAVTASLEKEIADSLASPPAAGSQALERLPLAMPNLDGVLDLSRSLHPQWQSRCAAFFSLAGPAYGIATRLDKTAWSRICDDMNIYESWLATQPAARAVSLGEPKARALLESNSLTQTEALIARDLEEAPKAANLASLRRLSLLKRDFLRILRNFVNMYDFYAKKDAIFQSGRLFIDGKELELCLEVHRPGAHATGIQLASTYLIYCDISRASGEKGSIVAALTGGRDADNIYVGRNGIYIDRLGNSWDAVVTKLVVQPISIREAFFSPYKLLVRTIEELAMKRAANAEAARMNAMKGAAQAAVEQPGKATQAAPVTAAKPIDVGTVAAIGVALGSIGAMITTILSLFFNLGPWIPVAIVGILLLISGPSMLLAAMKLRRRDLAPILNAEGWATNGKLKINMVFGAALSHFATLPAGSVRTFNDPYEQKKKRWPYVLLVLLIIILLVLLVPVLRTMVAGWFGL